MPWHFRGISVRNQLIKQAGFSTTYENDRLDNLINITVIEVLKVLNDPSVVNRCVGTTFDASIAGCIVGTVTDEVCKKFSINKPQDLKYEPIMGRKVSS